MRIRHRFLAIPLLLAASAMPALGDVRDKAGLFSPEAIEKANTELARVERETKIPVTIETTPSLKGMPIGEALTRSAEHDGVRGLFVLIAKSEGKIDAAASREYRRMFSRPQLQSIYEAFEPGFRKREFDEGLMQGVDHIAKVLPAIAKSAPAAATRQPAQAPAPVAGPRMPAQARSGFGTLIGIVLLVLGVVIVFRLLGSLFGAGRGGYGAGPGGYGPGPMRGPGYGGPGYGGGGGGGGFMSSLFGGLGGAMAGNWLYDQFGRHHSADPTTSVPGTESAPPADAGPDWQDAGDGGGDWGGGGDGGGGGGGDWGGSGGGGDWGGGGGGDWGGGGGGDWGGGGGGDGGSW